MTSMLVFAIAFAVGCVSGVIVALWSLRRRLGKSGRTSSFWATSDDEPTTVQRAMRR